MQHEYRHKQKVKLADLPELSPDENSSTKICCPNCEQEVPAANVNIQEVAGKCDACNSLFSLKPVLSSLHRASTALHHEELDRPAGVEVNYFNNEMEISIQQTQIWSMIALIIAPVFLTIGLLIYFRKGLDWALIMSAISAAMGIYGVWKTVNRKKYRTYITLSKAFLDVEHRPRKLSKDQSYAAVNIDQFFVAADPQLGGYALFALINDIEGQKRQRIFGGITSQVKAKYLEQEMEKYLGITNKKVIGETV